MRGKTKRKLERAVVASAAAVFFLWNGIFWTNFELERARVRAASRTAFAALERCDAAVASATSDLKLKTLAGKATARDVAQWRRATATAFRRCLDEVSAIDASDCPADFQAALADGRAALERWTVEKETLADGAELALETAETAGFNVDETPSLARREARSAQGRFFAAAARFGSRPDWAE
ncbi:MAG: hypothetical protein IJ387_12135 [Thermoguttaceae bacterium]|nr:hypothetical protein [Thermoguttaceae bacterium]